MMDISEEQVEAIRQWAHWEDLIKEVYLLGSRAKGTAKEDSDTDIALAFTVDDAEVERMFVMNGEFWQDELRRRTGLLVNLAHLAGDLTPKHTAAVNDHGIRLYPAP